MSASILRRMFDGQVELKVACPKWRRELEVSYGLFGDGSSCLKIKIDDVVFRGHSILAEVRKMPGVVSFIESCIWRDAEQRAEMILMRRWHEKCGDGSRAGSIIKKALSRLSSSVPRPLVHA
jgi:hypothetical protein